jgi:hypothetical protein
MISCFISGCYFDPGINFMDASKTGEGKLLGLEVEFRP